MRLPYSWLREIVQAGAPGWELSPEELEHDVDPHRPRGRGDHPGRPGQRPADDRPGDRDRGAHRVQEADPRRQGGCRRSMQPRDIVCGATNFAVGDLVVVALPGTVLPGDFTIATRQTYGRTSDGMICSTSELNLGSDHSGILVLPPGTAEPGAPAADVLGLDDVVFHLAITPDRGYCLSVRGMAREIANAYDLDYVDPASIRSATARRRRGVAGDDRTGHRGAALRIAAGHRDRPESPVAVVDSAQAAAQRHPGHFACGRCHQLRDARTGPPDARPRPQPDLRRVPGALRRTRGRRS